jgi:hypothetical protein
MRIKAISCQMLRFTVTAIAACFLAGCGSSVAVHAGSIPVPERAFNVERGKAPGGGEQVDFSVNFAPKSTETLSFYRDKYPSSRGWKVCRARGYGVWSVHYSLKGLKKNIHGSDINKETRYMYLMYSKRESGMLLVVLYGVGRNSDGVAVGSESNSFQRVRVVLHHIGGVELQNYIDELKC